MQNDNRAPFAHGMEIEQFRDRVPSDVRNYTMNNDWGVTDGWHYDGSGPYETSIGPSKTAKSVLNTFFQDSRDEDITWDWHASDGARRGAGSHVHLGLVDGVFENEVEAITIAFNTAVEIVPFMAPFFCHNWEKGFRDGAELRGGRYEYTVEKWASRPKRATESRVENYLSNPTGNWQTGHDWGRKYEAVTFSVANNSTGKPMTIELRLNDAHPSMALNGLLQVRRVAGCAIENGVSPKLENHVETMKALYDAIYGRAARMGLMSSMKEPLDTGTIRFQEGRGIPGVSRMEFETPFEVLEAINREYTRSPGNWKARGVKLVSSGRDDYSPSNNIDSLWQIDAPIGEFEWQNGPDTGPQYEMPTVESDATELTDLQLVGAGRADSLREVGITCSQDIQDASLDDLQEAQGVGYGMARKLKSQVDGVLFDVEVPAEVEAEELIAEMEAEEAAADGGVDESMTAREPESYTLDELQSMFMADEISAREYEEMREIHGV